MNEQLKFDIVDGVAIITLNRPDAYNSLSDAIIEGLGSAYQRCDEDDDIRVVVVTGAGTAFCAGADMSGVARHLTERGRATVSIPVP
ncbi:MAG: enoyl-CoA hydratase/isomerase family protein [Haliea sp.]|nr:enoyl-CoA hydratase/isomerase family protein [Haliea sp.]